MGHTTEKVCALFLCNFMVKYRKGVYAMQVNGVSIPLEKPQTLLEFLNEKGYNLHRIAVEHRCSPTIPRNSRVTSSRRSWIWNA